MEAMASTSGSGFRFHPSDESLVVNFLLPRNVSNEVTESSSIIDDYPYRIERWNLLVAHEKDVEEGAYFLAKKAKLSSKGLRRKRTVSDADKILGTRRADKILGTWRIQHSNTDWALADMTVRLGWSKTLLSYYSADDNSKTTGYVMNEYELLYDGTGGGSEGFGKCETYKYVICHVKLSDREISRRKRRKESAATSCSSTSGTSTSSSASVSPASNPHSAPSLALPSSLWPGILPQPAAAFEAPLVAASNVDAATLATVRHEFPSDYFSSVNTLNDNDSYFLFPDLLTGIVDSLNSLE